MRKITFLVLFLVPPAAWAQNPVTIGEDKQLFFDDLIIQDLGGAKRVPQQAKKHPTPVLTADQPWEGRHILYPSVVKEGNTLKVWYLNSADLWNTSSYVTLTATSTDGITWSKPKLGLYAANGNKNNNIIWDGRVGSVVPDPGGKGYKMYRTEYPVNSKQEYYGFSSADGVTWTDKNLYMDNKRIESSPLAGRLYRAFDIEHFAYDSKTRKYILVTKVNDFEVNSYYGNGETYVRKFLIGTADDMRNLAATPFPMELTTIAEAADIPPSYGNSPTHDKVVRVDPYFHQVMPYEGLYVGLTSHFYITEVKQSNGWAHSGGMEVHLNFTRDLSKQFQRPFRLKPVIVRGKRKSDKNNGVFYHDPTVNDWDWGMVSLATEPIVMGDKILAFYQGANCEHNQAGNSGKKWSMGLATWRLDGFVSLNSDATEDVITTKPLVFAGNRLQVNSRAVVAGGTMHVEILDTTGNILMAKSDPIIGDNTRHIVTWGGKGDLGSLAGMPVVLKLYSTKTELYSLKFTSGTGGVGRVRSGGGSGNCGLVGMEPLLLCGFFAALKGIPQI